MTFVGVNNIQCWDIQSWRHCAKRPEEQVVSNISDKHSTKKSNAKTLLNRYIVLFGNNIEREKEMVKDLDLEVSLPRLDDVAAAVTITIKY